MSQSPSFVQLMYQSAHMKICPWCKQVSTDEDDCEHCGAPMDGSDYYECPYCGERKISDQGACCKEIHIQRVTLQEVTV